jgi:hypothetical protein
MSSSAFLARTIFSVIALKSPEAEADVLGRPSETTGVILGFLNMLYSSTLGSSKTFFGVPKLSVEVIETFAKGSGFILKRAFP